VVTTAGKESCSRHHHLCAARTRRVFRAVREREDKIISKDTDSER
jgi:hypothetical protein